MDFTKLEYRRITRKDIDNFIPGKTWFKNPDLARDTRYGLFKRFEEGKIWAVWDYADYKYFSMGFETWLSISQITSDEDRLVAPSTMKSRKKVTLKELLK